MKELLLIRHAKSSWDHDVEDVNRPLSDRGFKDANLLANEFLNYSFQPDGIFSSPANRALTTCKLFMTTLHYDMQLLIISDKLYDFDGQQVANFIHNLDDQLDTVMIFGHNHAFTAIANSFGSEYIDNVPTCGMVKLKFNTDSWKDIKNGHTEFTLFPRHLKI